MAKKRVKTIGTELTAIMRDMLEEYGDEVKAKATETLQKMGPEIALQVKDKSRQFKGTGTYADGWTSKTEVDNKGTVKEIVYNAKQPTLTHLLEYGHRGYPLKNGGRTRDVKGRPHIAPVYKQAIEDAVKQIERKLEQ